MEEKIDNHVIYENKSSKLTMSFDGELITLTQFWGFGKLEESLILHPEELEKVLKLVREVL